MRALVCGQPPTLVTDHPEPVRRPGEVTIALRVAGVCDTDLALARGYMAYKGVLGHEFVGTVLETDDTTTAVTWRGRRVVADINAGCGVCAECRERGSHHCGARTVLGIVGRDGALAERFTVPERCLVAVPDAVPDDKAVFAEPLAAALHVLSELPGPSGPAGGPVVVLGDGKLGQLIARAVVSSGRRTVMVGHHETKLVLARRAGIETVLERDVSADLNGVPAVVEATGSASGIALALRLVRPRGTVILKTTIAGPTTVDLSPVVIHELSVVGSRCGDLAQAVDALARGLVDPTDLLAARYPLTRADVALEHAGRAGTLKVLVEG
ncbi:MAG TPA: alcohol dehydrogenase catalytic domain-containing protein [Polyangiaceae bacterium]